MFEVLDGIIKLDSEVRYADEILFSIRAMLVEAYGHYINIKRCEFFKNEEERLQSIKLCKSYIEMSKGKLEELKSLINEIERELSELETLLSFLLNSSSSNV